MNRCATDGARAQAIRYLVRIRRTVTIALLVVGVAAAAPVRASAIEIVLCGGLPVDGACPPKLLAGTYVVPESYLGSLPSDRAALSQGFWLDVRKIPNLDRNFPLLAQELGRSAGLYHEIWVRPGGESFEQFVARAHPPSRAHRGEFADETSFRQAHTWFRYEGFWVRRSRPAEVVLSRPHDLATTSIRMADGSAISATCIRDISLQGPSGCRVYDLREPALRLDYTTVVASAERLLAVSKELHRLISQFAKKKQGE